jgi:hypothetical protein
MRSFLSGGSVALMTYGGASILKLPFKQSMLLMGINFLGMGLYRMGEFLNLHGAPDQLQVTLNKAAAAQQVATEAVEQAKSQVLLGAGNGK